MSKILDQLIELSDNISKTFDLNDREQINMISEDLIVLREYSDQF